MSSLCVNDLFSFGKIAHMKHYVTLVVYWLRCKHLPWKCNICAFTAVVQIKSVPFSLCPSDPKVDIRLWVVYSLSLEQHDE